MARGIISAEQRDALLALDAGAMEETPAEARRGLNSVTVAYGLGGAAVVFAFGWFVADRWEVLGPAGVLAVSALYALLFSFTARYLGRLGFETAASVAALVAVATAPLAAFINAGGYGDYIVDGFYTLHPTEILAGAIPVALIAILVEVLLGGLERLLTPVGLRKGTLETVRV